MPSWLSRTNRDGYTPLDLVIRAGRLDLAEWMVAREQDDRSSSLRASTPLHRAAALALPEAVRALLRCGANPQQRDMLGELPIHKSVRMNDKNSVRLLIDCCDINLSGYDGMTPLHWACLLGRGEIIHLLLAAGADPSRPNPQWDNLTPAQLLALAGGVDDLLPVDLAEGGWKQEEVVHTGDQTIGV